MITHGKRFTTETYYDGTVVNTDEEEQSEKFTDKQYLMRDVIDSLVVITSGQTKKLVIEVCLDKQDRYKLTQRWRVQ